MWSVFLGILSLVIALIGLVYLIEYLATRYPHTTLGRICKAIDTFIERLPDD